jgi:hypothetical protein
VLDSVFCTSSCYSIPTKRVVKGPKELICFLSDEDMFQLLYSQTPSISPQKEADDTSAVKQRKALTLVPDQD